jgi:capsular polysaccharide biosynthesis protein
MPDEQNVGGDPVSSVTLGENVTYKDLEGIVLADEARTVSLRARERQLDQTVSASARRLNDLVDLEVENKRLTRQVEADEGNYEVQRKALEERRISVQMDLEQIASVSVIEAATVPLQPIGPRKLLAVALSIPLGFLLGLGFAFISERSDRSFTREEDVERANDAPVIGTLPDSGNSTSDAPKRDGRGRASRRQRRRGSEPGGEHS